MSTTVAQKALVDILVGMHKPEFQAESMVYEVWNDGEITLTKGGELYGQRRLHLQAFGDESKALPVELFPEGCHRFRNARIIVPDHATALLAHEMILAD